MVPMTPHHKVAAIQMVSTADVQANIVAAGKLIRQAAESGASLVVLPENFAVLDGGPLPQFAEREGDRNGLLQSFLSREAKNHGIYLVGGTIPLITRPRTGHAIEAPQSAAAELTDGRVRPASLLFGPDGELIARYDKIHLFDVTVEDRQATYSESRSFEPGDDVVVADTVAGRLGMSICYDLRFPELYRRLLEENAEIVCVPSAFTQVTGAAHWEPLLRARAIENQCYVIAANQGGVHNETRETYGHSMIIDPWGAIVAVVEKGEGVAVASIDIDWLHDLRRRMPVRSHRRL
jgi:deaminated glutathione amidase